MSVGMVFLEEILDVVYIFVVNTCGLIHRDATDVQKEKIRLNQHLM
jgi:hypothetical protein